MLATRVKRVMLRFVLRIFYFGLALTLVASYSVAGSCANDPSECTHKTLCEIATDVSDNIRSWSDVETAQKHVEYARKIGANCEISDKRLLSESALCATNPRKCTVGDLCSFATDKSNGRIVWNEQKFSRHVQLAKEYGLSCNTAANVLPDPKARYSQTGIWTKAPEQPVLLSDSVVCTYATMRGTDGVKWEKGSSYLEYVAEAKKRNLSCGVETSNASAPSKTPPQPSVTSNHLNKPLSLSKPLYLSNSELCNEATWGKTTKNWYHDFNEYTIEAKKRGLDCGVEKSVDNESQQTVSKVQLSKVKCSAWNNQNCVKTLTTDSGNEFIGRHLNNVLYGTITYRILAHGPGKGDVRIGQRQDGQWYGPNLYIWQSGHARFDLDVPNGTYSSNSDVNDVFPELKSTFIALGQKERMLLQESLANKKLYSTTIDGLWGRNTLIGISRFSAEYINTVNLRSKRNVELVLNGLIKQKASNLTNVADPFIIDEVEKRDQAVRQIISDSSNIMSTYRNETVLKRKQIQYALRKLGYYYNTVDGIWGEGTKSAIVLFQLDEGLFSANPDQIFRRLLQKVDVP